MKTQKKTVDEIVSLKYELTTHYQAWYEQMRRDDTFYTQKYQVFPDGGAPPDGYEQVRPPSATQIIDMAADHSAGNFPLIHVPRRKETAQAQSQTTLMEKAGQGFWYRCIAKSPRNPIRSWAQSGALRGAIGASLLYVADAWPDKPLPSEHGGTQSKDYKDAFDEYEALARSAWPFKLDYIDPLMMLPDPETEGQTYIIVAFKDTAAAVKRRWPDWDWRINSTEAVKPTDEVEFISYWDDTYCSYIVSGQGMDKGRALTSAYDGVRKHGYGFLPYSFTAGGYGSPFGKPEDRYAGLITRALDLLSLEARRTTHLDALIGQQAFPNIIKVQGLNLNKTLGGYMTAPSGVKPSEAIFESRPVIPVQEIVIELQSIRASIQRATLPDSLSSEPSKSDESGYLRSLKIGTGRSRIRSLSDALERTAEWATSGFYRLVENKVKGPVSTWGKNMGADDAFISIGPDDIKGHYEVYCSLTPSLPQDDTTNIHNGTTLYEHGAIPIRDLLETYAGRENAEELLKERIGEDILKSPEFMAQLVKDSMAVTGVTGGPIAAPGFASGPQGLGAGGAPQMGANPLSNAGVPNVPTPPMAPGSLQDSLNTINRSQHAGANGPPTAGPLQGIQRGRA